MTFHLASRVEEVLRYALEPASGKNRSHLNPPPVRERARNCNSSPLVGRWRRRRRRGTTTEQRNSSPFGEVAAKPAGGAGGAGGRAPAVEHRRGRSATTATSRPRLRRRQQVAKSAPGEHRDRKPPRHPADQRQTQSQHRTADRLLCEGVVDAAPAPARRDVVAVAVASGHLPLPPAGPRLGDELKRDGRCATVTVDSSCQRLATSGSIPVVRIVAPRPPRPAGRPSREDGSRRSASHRPTRGASVGRSAGRYTTSARAEHCSERCACVVFSSSSALTP